MVEIPRRRGDWAGGEGAWSGVRGRCWVGGRVGGTAMCFARTSSTESSAWKVHLPMKRLSTSRVEAHVAIVLVRVLFAERRAGMLHVAPRCIPF